MTKNTNAGQSNLTSPLSPKAFPSPPIFPVKAESPTLLPLDIIQDSENRTNSLNGVSPSTPADTVTVTHFSEKRGTMEKISVPSLNIFNAEFKADSSKSVTKPSTNPFLNTSPITLTSTSSTIHTTNPFHVSLTATSNETEPISSINNHLKANDVISICSENNNDTIVTLISKMDTPKTTSATNPFTVAIDEIDTDNTVKIKTNNNDALNNIKNNNVVANDKAEPSLDELNKNKKNIEVNFNRFIIFLFFLVSKYTHTQYSYTYTHILTHQNTYIFLNCTYFFSIFSLKNEIFFIFVKKRIECFVCVNISFVALMLTKKNTIPLLMKYFVCFSYHCPFLFNFFLLGDISFFFYIDLKIVFEISE